MVVKVGTRVLTRTDGTLDPQRIEMLTQDLHEVMETGRSVVLVSSGAVGAGIGRLGLRKRPTDLAQLQAVAAAGQSLLVEAYERSLQKFGYHVAQVLLTAEDLDHRKRYLNARNTILALLEYGVLPIINENDTVSVDELQTTFGDNDRLAAMVTNLIQAPLLVLLSDVEGLCDGEPASPGVKIVPTVEQLGPDVFALAQDAKTGLSKGGMASKLEAARQATGSGENVIIASGRKPGVLQAILEGQRVGTAFLAQGQTIAARKRWIGYTVQPRGKLMIDGGARRAVEYNGGSLLAIGVVRVNGHFSKGDVVAVCDAEDHEFARGLSNYSSDDIRRIRGLRTDEIPGVLGHCPYEEVIHRDNLLVTTTGEA
jgi:glutamate 5-kinase